MTTTSTATSLPALTGSPKQIAWAEKIRATELKSLSDRAEQIIADFAIPMAEHPAEGAEMVARIHAFVAAQAAKAEASYWINDLRTAGAPRQQLNRLVEEWAAEVQTQIEARIAAEADAPKADMTIDEIVEAISAYNDTTLRYVDKTFSLAYVNAIEAVSAAYTKATENLCILYLARGINPFRYHIAAPAERLEAARQLKTHMTKVHMAAVRQEV